MCNKGFQCLNECESEVDQRQEFFVMDSPIRSPAAGSGSGEDSRRVKFLCSFLGSIMPRPQDGKLRYVGGETRIVSVCRDISYEELMVKMRELYDGAAVLKYQQPDEDLDALVSVVNDDDVVNMMEEYDKLGSGDGFTRLRIFLFSQSEQDGSSHFIDGDDSERRYVDALNSLNDVADFRRLQQGEFPMISPVEDIHVAGEQFFNPMSVESGIHTHRSGDLSMPPYNMHHLSIQHPQTVGPRYTEMDSPWNPAYYSPRHHALHDSRSLVEFPSSPSGRYRMPFPELPDKCIDRGPEDYARHHVNHHPVYDNQQQYADNVLWVPTGAAHSEKTGFPGNILHGSHVVDGNNICEQCRMGFQRGQPHLEHSNISNGLLPVANPCGECPLPNRDAFPMNVDAKLHPAMYPNEPNGDHRSVYNDTQNHDRGWGLQHPTTARVEESRGHLSVSGRVGDVPVANISLGHGSVTGGHALSSNYLHQPVGPELGTELFPDQTLTASPHVQIAPLEECNVRYGNPSSPYGVDSNYAVPRGHPPGLWRNTPIPVHLGPSYEANTSPPQVNGMINAALVRGEGSPGFYIGPDTQNQWVDSSQKLTGHDCKAIPEYSHAHALNLNPTLLGPENQHPVTVDTIHPPQDVSTGTCLEPLQVPKSSFNMVHNQEVLRNDTHLATAKTFESNTLLGEGIVVKIEDKVKGSDTQTVYYSEQNKVAENACPAAASVDSNNSKSKPEGDCRHVEKLADEDHSVPQDYKHLGNQLSLLPELIASVKRDAVEVAEVVKTAAKDDPANTHNQNLDAKGQTINEVEPENAHGDLELNSESDHVDTSKIEPTKAEEEAIARGLQTIKNDDLEEIRELGSGTYGAVYHGKWKGSDVAIKRIKASCFAGRPSERARLITDFWKEALMLSSLHHPNVVSFYGIVRDGPDSSLATVTEFMINGSLKQFLHKKDRTIDRRKRLIIAMDAAFGMEYLHGKNIVHFDLKCENLLVNMRDPQRPVCKIGDLGLSKVKQNTLVSGGVRGTLPWMAPELLSGKSNMVSEKIDVYSFGVVMWELLTGDEPYADMHCASIIGGIVNNSLRPQIPSWCDPEWKSLMESCWASDPAERPSFSEISKKLRSMASSMNVK